MMAVDKNTMKDILKELRKLGGTVATLLGCMVIAIGVFLIAVIVMRETYCHPLEEYGVGVSSHGWSGRPGGMIRMLTSPMCNGRLPKVYHR